MARLGDFLGKQGHFLIENDRYALIGIVVLAIIPFAVWLSVAIVALITLRKGWFDGFKGFIAAFVAILTLSSLSMPFYAAAVTALLAVLPCYLTAGILHSTTSWRVTGSFIVLQALLAILLIHWLAPEFIANQYHYFQMMVKELEYKGSDSVSGLLNDNAVFNQTVANTLVGIQALSLMLSMAMSLLLARSIQARLFYPGGFKEEMLGFRASNFGVLLLGAVVIGAYQHHPVALSCLPVLVTYYVCAGLSLCLDILAKKDKGVITLLLLIILLALLPFVIVPVYTILGALDSLFNFRLHLFSRADKKETKG